MTSVAVVDYGMGNTGSLLNMLKRIGVPAVLTDDVAVLSGASHLILPGVGAFDSAMRSLRDRKLIDVLAKLAIEEKKPFLGICLGMQLLANRSEEGNTTGLGWIDASVIRFEMTGESKLPVPHMSWNGVSPCGQSMLFSCDANERYYFVHSYHVVCEKTSDIAASTDYGVTFTSAISHENIYGVQFHPEKSHRFGRALLERFVSLDQRA